MSKVTAWIFFLTVHFSHAQNIKGVIRALEKQDYKKAQNVIQKNSLKYPNHVTVLYAYFAYFFDRNNPKYSIDSAYVYLQRSKDAYRKSFQDDIDILAKFNVNNDTLQVLGSRIEKAAFMRSKRENTLTSYNYFIDFFSSAKQKKEATQLRNKLAYQKVQSQDTYQAYENFMKTYPTAKEVPLAQGRYDTLIFQSSISKGTLEEYLQFLENHPKTPFKDSIQSQIYQLTTLDHSVKNYQNFINNYPKNPFVKEALHWIWYYNHENYPSSKYGDVISPEQRTAKQRASDRLFPFFKNNLYGFANTKGEVIVEPVFENLTDGQQCEFWQETFLLGMQNKKLGAYNRAGQKILDFAYRDIQAFDEATLQFTTINHKMGLVRNTGEVIIPANYDKIKRLGHGVLAVYKDRKWQIRTYKNQILSAAEFDDVKSLYEKNILLKKGTRWSIFPVEDLFKKENKKNWSKLNYDIISIRNYKEQSIHLLYTLDGVSLALPSGKVKELPTRQIEIIKNNIIAKKDDNYYLYNLEGTSSSTLFFDEVTPLTNGFGVRKNDKWGIFSENYQFVLDTKYDSLASLANDVVFLKRGNQELLYFYNNTLLSVDSDSEIKLDRIKFYTETQKDSSDWFIQLKKSSYITVINSKGERQLRMKQPVNIFDNGMVQYQKDSRVGLKNLKQKVVLNAQYEGIVPIKNGMFSILKNKKFGLFDSQNGKVIPPKYESNIKLLNDTLFLVKYKKLFGVVNPNDKVLVKPVFEKIEVWNDTSVVAYKDQKWQIVDFYTQAVHHSFEEYEYIGGKEEDIFLIKDKNWGVMSNVRGIIHESKYQHISYFEDEDSPLFLLATHVDQADIYVLVYTDVEGNTIAKSVLNGEEFSKIPCFE